MRDYKPNPRIIDRAVQWWIQALSAPKYDNLGDDSRESFKSQVTNRFAGALAAKLPKNNTPDVLEKFGQALRAVLMTPKENGYTPNYLSVDYGPDEHLSEAATAAGLKMQFPWKTHMFLADDYFSVSCGYAAPDDYHYPLSEDRWLVVKLSGKDIPKIIALVEAGIIDTDLKPTGVLVA